MSTELTTDVIDVTPEPIKALTDLRSASMGLSVPQMQVALSEYKERRIAFRDWLRSQMIEGIHYGYPPGCRKSNASEKEWQNKPSLYKAGAEFICDLMQWRAEYRSDIDAWKMLGEQPNTYVMECKLISRMTGEFMGNGLGSRKVGDKGMGDVNGPLKMAQKNALVAAVLNVAGISDLFTQDIEDMPEPHANPPKNEQAPTAPTRQQRATKPKKTDEICQRVWRAFFSVRSEEFDGSLELAKKTFTAWVKRCLGRDFDLKDDTQWNAEDEQYCIDKLEEFKKR